LVWDSEREPEQVVLDCENNLPVLKRVKGKEIRTVDEDDNILIEGDNYHALTVLNYTHKEKVDVIYIDPPYNTGNKDFIYNDRYVDKEDGFRHSKWLNFMEKRLKLAKDLLKETGVIFISIDDHEAAQLKLLCDNIFGESNFVANLIWKSKSGGASDSKFFAVDHEYILVYTSNSDKFKLGLDTDATVSTSYNLNDEKGEYALDRLDKQSLGYLKSLDFPIIGPDGKKYKVLHKDSVNKVARWRWSRNSVKNRYDELVFKWPYVYTKNYKKEGSVPRSILIEERFGRTRTGKTELFEFFKMHSFNNPKPSKLIKFFVKIISKKDITVLDFMAGSGTTGHAVLDLNKEDGGNRKFILCTNNELNGMEKELREKGMGEKEIAEHGICRRVTYTRLEKVIKGYKNPKGTKIEGLGGNLQYFRTDLVKKTRNKDQVRINLTQKCTEMLCVKENIFNLDTKKDDYKIFSSNKKDKFLGVYYNFFDDSFEDFLKELKKLKGKKIIYMFSIDGKTDSSLFSDLEDCKIEEIPQKIIDIYKQLVKMNIPVKSDFIFSDFEKAKEIIFNNKEKDDGARILRIVIEKVIQKIAQNNGVNILRNNAKEEKLTILNDKLKSENIFSKVEWEENKTYITIGNHAAHGEYSEYDLKNTENFYKHIQKLIEHHNIK
jgi:adenine-specific DNA-methyltransferase